MLYRIDDNYGANVLSNISEADIYNPRLSNSSANQVLLSDKISSFMQSRAENQNNRSRSYSLRDSLTSPTHNRHSSSLSQHESKHFNDESDANNDTMSSLHKPLV